MLNIDYRIHRKNGSETCFSGRIPSESYLYTYKKENAWRAHQSDFILKRRKKRFLQKSVRLSLLVIIPSLLILGAWYFLDLETFFKTDIKTQNTSPAQTKTLAKEVEISPEVGLSLKNEISPEGGLSLKNEISIVDLKGIIREIPFFNTTKTVFFVDTQEKSYTIATSLDAKLQKTLVSTMKYLKTLGRGKPQRIAIVALNPDNGNIKGMAGFDQDDSRANPCLASDYPAASIIKIITASAAVDSLGYTAHTPLYFNGNKYTLYKRQLSQKKNKYTTKITLARAFAKSINPIFGKLGKNDLGRKRLDAYAQAFGFNQTPDSELEFESGRFSAAGSEFHLAELGCGFNKDTMISPLFGAMLVTNILNSGTSLVPHIVDQVTTDDGQIIYKGQKASYKTPITPKTAKTMITLMETTIKKGTAKKSFRGFSRDKVLSKLIIGGKTGSLYNREGTVKYDWFVGFGKEKSGNKRLAVAVVVGHKKYIGTRASTHARKILKTYFKGTPTPSPKKMGQKKLGKRIGQKT